MKPLPEILLALTVVAALSIVCPAKANLITNGGFETGDFTSWAQVGGNIDGTLPHSGNFAASFSSTGALQQSVATTLGASYTINFFLAFIGTPLFHHSFTVSWGGETLLTLNQDCCDDYTEFAFNVTAPDPSTELLFQFDPAFPIGFWLLDDVSVTSGIPDGGSAVSLLGFALLGLTALRRKLGC